MVMNIPTYNSLEATLELSNTVTLFISNHGSFISLQKGRDIWKIRMTSFMDDPKSFRKNFRQKSLFSLVTAWIIACPTVHYSHSKEISSSWKSLITPRMLCLTLAMLEISTAHLKILHCKNIILYISQNICMHFTPTSESILVWKFIPNYLEMCSRIMNFSLYFIEIEIGGALSSQNCHMAMDVV